MTPTSPAGMSRPTVIMWRNRYAAGGLGAPEDLARSGRPREIDPLEVVIATLEPPPARLGVTQAVRARLPHLTAVRARAEVAILDPSQPVSSRGHGLSAAACSSRGVQRHTKAARSPETVKAPSRLMTACTSWRTSATTSAQGRVT
jgi:hypothetical protein